MPKLDLNQLKKQDANKGHESKIANNDSLSPSGTARKGVLR
jgi:hypothetical protein